MRAIIVIAGLLSMSLAGSAQAQESTRVFPVEKEAYVMSEKVLKSDEEWRRTLTPEQFRILHEKGTERTALLHELGSTDFCGRRVKNPNEKEVSAGGTAHVEAVRDQFLQKIWGKEGRTSGDVDK